MVKLVPIVPWKNFESWDNMKLYPWWLNQVLYDLLDKPKFESIPLNQIWNWFPECKNIMFIRHLESIYNEYKKKIRKDPRYLEFKITNDPTRKQILAIQLLEEYRTQIWIDFSTWISQEWHLQWEKYWKLYAQIIRQNPEIFPEMIIVSPYLRTRITAHYFLRYIEWLDLDIERLIDPKNRKDLLIWTFNWKQVSIKFNNRFRERDHGSDVAPSFLRDYIQSLSPFNPPKDVIWEDWSDIMYYFNAPPWWESMVSVEDRIKIWLDKLMGEEVKNIMVVSHHIAILAVLNNIFWWSLNTYFNLDDNWKPQNWSISLVSQIPKTKNWQLDKLRVSAYNCLLEE